MDIQLEKKKGLQKKHIPYVAGGVLFVILLGWIIFGDHASTLKVDARGISIGNVTRGRGCPSEERRYHCSSEQLKSRFADLER